MPGCTPNDRVRFITTLCVIASGAACAATQPSEAERLAQAVEQLRTQVAAQRDQIEGLTHQVTVLRANAQDGTQARVGDGRGPPELEVVRLSPPPAKPEPPERDPEPPVIITLHGDAEAPVPQSITDAGRNSFTEALAAYQRGEMTRAHRLFSGFLARHPDHEDAAAATYWVGECRLEQGDSAGAIRAFRDLLRTFPKSDKRASALLKLGLAYKRQRSMVEARATFSELVRAYPTSALADLARAHLASAGDP